MSQDIRDDEKGYRRRASSSSVRSGEAPRRRNPGEVKEEALNSTGEVKEEALISICTIYDRAIEAAAHSSSRLEASLVPDRVDNLERNVGIESELHGNRGP